MLPLHLEWSAPPECPTGEQVERELSRITHARPGRVLLPLDARANITRRGDGYHLALVLNRHGELSEAQFDSQVCAPLRKAATLVLALAYGDGLEFDDAAPEADAADARAPNDVPASKPATAATAGERDRAAIEWKNARERNQFTTAPWLAATWTSGFIAPSAAGAEAGLGMGSRYWRAFGRLSAFPLRTAAVQGEVSAELSAVAGALGGCAAWSSPAFTLAGCLAFESGLVRAHSKGAVSDSSATAPWYALNPAAVLSFPVAKPFALRAELGALVPLDAPRFDVAPRGTLYATAQVAPRFSLGLSVNL